MFTRADYLDFQRSCKLLSNSHYQKLSCINVQRDKILLKTKVTKLKTHHFLIILLYFTVIYIFEVISVHLCGRHTILWWYATARCFSAPGQRHVGSLKLAMMEGCTPQKLMNSTNQGFLFFLFLFLLFSSSPYPLLSPPMLLLRLLVCCHTSVMTIGKLRNLSRA